MMVIAWLFGPFFNLARSIPTTTLTSDGICISFRKWPNSFWYRFTAIINVGVVFFLPFLFIMILYISIFVHLRKQVSKGPIGESNRKQSEVMDRAKANVLKTLIVLSVCFFLCSVWNVTYFLLFTLGANVSITSSFYSFSVIMININCCINPFCYAVQYREFQEQVRNLFCNCKSSTKKKMISSATVSEFVTSEGSGS